MGTPLMAFCSSPPRAGSTFAVCQSFAYFQAYYNAFSHTIGFGGGAVCETISRVTVQSYQQCGGLWLQAFGGTAVMQEVISRCNIVVPACPQCSLPFGR